MRERELATFDENRRALRMLNSMRDKNWRHVPGGRDDTFDHGLSRRSLTVKPPTSWYIYRRPRWLGRSSSCLLKSISRVQFSPNAHTCGDFFLHKKVDKRKARERELATFDENRRALRMLNSMRDKNWRHVPGGREDTWDHGLPRRSLRVKPPSSWAGK